jgi:hypothetical protein
MEAACGGNCFIEFIALTAKTKLAQGQLILSLSLCLGITLTLRLLSSRALSFRMIMNMLTKDR